MSIPEHKLINLEKKANNIRRCVIEMLMEAGSGHAAGSLGLADVFTAFYFHILNHDPDNPEWRERDKMVVSNGHVAPALYAALAYAGYFPVEELKSLRKINSKLQGHPHRGSVPGIETTSGPLGSGLSQAIGMALSSNLDNIKNWTYVISSDGEHQEGNWWEAVMYAGKKRHDMHRLITLVDRNNIQIDGFTEDIMPLEPLIEKYEAFNWHVAEADGHNIESVIDAVSEAKAIHEQPSVIITHTVPGKGVDFMERDFRWHGKSPDKSEAELALEELRTLGGRIESGHE
ncbi:MAG TPA: transketolase [Candidatus Paceibacterota bacterium]|nr:transketolase [Candidatus Paceibacterota bacterium]